MNNKPVAWMSPSGLEYHQSEKDFTYQHKENWIPLYTHPVKELTDDEIDEVALNNMEGVGRLVYMVQGNVKGGDFKEAVRSFAKAILRKASER